MEFDQEYGKFQAVVEADEKNKLLLDAEIVDGEEIQEASESNTAVGTKTASFIED